MDTIDTAEFVAAYTVRKGLPFEFFQWATDIFHMDELRVANLDDVAIMWARENA